MDRVAPELFEMITRFLPVTDVKNLRLVCKSFAELAARPLFKTVQIHALLASFEKFKIISQHETYRKYVQILIFYFDIFNPAEADSGLAFVAAFEQWRYKIKEVTSRYRTRRRSKEPLPYECSFELPSLAMEDELV
ncbi:hypothetical protein L228DRAFT_248600 [Xylona heveae TC161]|uniref:F-box domain-containing protein n=1 Tax=Xylona heveae (strain CBS 132557 / TC161) TaxID=1328760 RepID=A0A165G7Z2_XYLHT|nr:hypothetical protein L228DRAFT_248600 [Xylona heveae TC161]KZF21846.1 hypothetical protein L228DRAFT_248600 [Xylona heveae TC161]